jgi:hypothetical protein
MMFGGVPAPSSPQPQPEPEPEAVPNREAEKVEKWRCWCLLEAGYDIDAALLIAKSDADLHLAVAIVEQGCSPTTALLILL